MASANTRYSAAALWLLFMVLSAVVVTGMVQLIHQVLIWWGDSYTADWGMRLFVYHVSFVIAVGAFFLHWTIRFLTATYEDADHTQAVSLVSRLSSSFMWMGVLFLQNAMWVTTTDFLYQEIPDALTEASFVIGLVLAGLFMCTSMAISINIKAAVPFWFRIRDGPERYHEYAETLSAVPSPPRRRHSRNSRPPNAAQPQGQAARPESAIAVHRHGTAVAAPASMRSLDGRDGNKSGQTSAHPPHLPNIQVSAPPHVHEPMDSSPASHHLPGRLPAALEMPSALTSQGQADAELADRIPSMAAASVPETTASATVSSGAAIPELQVPMASKAATATVGVTEMTVLKWTHFRRAAEDCAEPLDELEVALDAMCSMEAPFYYRYTILSAVERRAGGQGLVQFANMANAQQKVAIKFYLDRQAFRRERELYTESQLRTMMPATLAIEDNASGAVTTPYGYQFPPFVIIECGQSLDEFARRNAADFVTIFQALSHAVRALARLHSFGYAHRDVKPGNILRRHQQHDWTLIDFGCTAHIGAVAGLSYSLRYAPPEVIQALEAGEKTIKVDAAVDVWAIGVIAFELLTGERAFATAGLEPAEAEQAILDAVSGRKRLPWEGSVAAPQLAKLRGLKRTVLRCLEREPGRRPTSEALLQSWDHMFDNLQSQGTVFTRTVA